MNNQATSIVFDNAVKRASGVPLTPEEEFKDKLARRHLMTPQITGSTTQGFVSTSPAPIPTYPTGQQTGPGAQAVSQPVPPAGQQPVPPAVQQIVPPSRDIEALKQYRNKIHKLNKIEDSLDSYEEYLRDTGSRLWPDSKKLMLKTAYTDLQMEVKELFELGVLTGPDMGLIESYILDPTTLEANVYEVFGGRKTLTDQLKIVRNKLSNARNSVNALFSQFSQPGQPGQPGQASTPQSRTSLNNLKTGAADKRASNEIKTWSLLQIQQRHKAGNLTQAEERAMKERMTVLGY